MADVDRLVIDIEAQSKEVDSKLDQLIAGLEQLNKTATQATSGLSKISSCLNDIKASMSGLGKNPGADQLASQLTKLSQAATPLNGFKSQIGSTVTALTKLGTVKTVLSDLAVVGKDGKTGMDAIKAGCKGLAEAVAPLANFKSQFSATINALTKVNSISISKETIDQLGVSCRSLYSALQPLTMLQDNGFSKLVNGLNRLGTAAQKLGAVSMQQLKTNTQQAAQILKQLPGYTNRAGKSANTATGTFGKLSNIFKKTKTTGNSLSDTMSSLGSTIKKAFSLTAVLYSVQQLIEKLSYCMKLSMDYTENLNLFSVAMGDAAGESKAFAENLQSLLGIDSSSFMRYQGVLKSIATGFGVSSDQANLMSKNLTQLTYDLSSFYNSSISEASEKVRSALSGELEPMRAYGYALDETTLQQIAYNNGINMSIRSMNQAQKAQLRYYAMMTQNTQVQGDMARTIQSPANALRILKQQFTILARAIGNAFIPALQAVLPYLVALAQVATNAANAIARFFGYDASALDGVSAGVSGLTDGIDDTTDSISGLTDGIDDTTDSIDDQTDSTKAASDALKDYLAGFDELNVMPQPSDSSDSGSGSGTDSGTDSGISGNDLGLTLPEYDMLAGYEGVAEELFGDFFAPMRSAWDKTGQYVTDNFMWMFDRFQRQAQVFGSIFNQAWSSGAAEAMFQDIYHMFGTLFGLVGDITDSLTRAFDVTGYGYDIWINLFDVIGNINSIVDGIFQSIRDAWADVGDTFALSFAGFIDNISWIWSKLTEIIDMLMKNGLGDALQGVWTVLMGVGSVLAQIWRLFSPIATFILSVVAAILIPGLKFIGAILSGIGEFLSWIAEKLAPIATQVQAFVDELLPGVFAYMVNLGIAVDNVIAGVCNFFTSTLPGFFTMLGEFFTVTIPGFFASIGQWWNDLWMGLCQSFFDALTSVGNWIAVQVAIWNEFWRGVGDCASQVATAIADWWNQKISELGQWVLDIVNRVKGYFTELGTAANNVATGIESWWSGIFTSFGDWLKSKLDWIGGLFSDPAQKLKDAFDGAMSFVKSLFSNFPTPHFSLPSIKVNGSFSINPPRAPSFSVEWIQYATGGFPETGEAFVANEAGPELVGKIGNRNAVVNQQQIVESVSNGVAQAVSKVLGSGNDSKQTIVIKVGSTEIARAVIDGMNSVNRQAGQTILTV